MTDPNKAGATPEEVVAARGCARPSNGWKKISTHGSVAPRTASAE